MSQVIIGIVGGAVAAIVGAVVNHVLALRTERARQDREDRFRLHGERRKLYEEMQLKLDSAMRYPGEDFSVAYDEFSRLVAAIGLIAPGEVVRAADRASMAAQVHHSRSREFAENRTSGKKAERAALDLEEAAEEFVTAARKDLRIPIEDATGDE